MKNITLSIDETVLQSSREYAKRHHISFNFLVRKLVEQRVMPHKDNWLHDTFSLMDTLHATSSGEKWTREELYRV